MPGLIDAHAHITATGILKVEMVNGAPVVSMKIDEAITQRNARVALARGVTTVRNPAGNPEENAQYDRMIASGAWTGPEARHAGAAIQPPPMGGVMFAYPRTEAEWQAEASRQAKLGMTYFKLYTDLSEQELATGIRVAHEHGLQAIAHLNNVSWTRAVELGIDGLEHALPTSPDLLEPEARARYIAERDVTSRFMYRWFEHADFNGPLIRRLVELLAKKKIRGRTSRSSSTSSSTTPMTSRVFCRKRNSSTSTRTFSRSTNRSCAPALPAGRRRTTSVRAR